MAVINHACRSDLERFEAVYADIVREILTGARGGGTVVARFKGT